MMHEMKAKIPNSTIIVQTILHFPSPDIGQKVKIRSVTRAASICTTLLDSPAYILNFDLCLTQHKVKMNTSVLLAIVGIVAITITCVIMFFALLHLCCGIISGSNKVESNVDLMRKNRSEMSQTETSDLDICGAAIRAMPTKGPRNNKEIWIEA